VGMADPNGVVVANACAQAFDRVGLPEGRYPLAQAALYLATCAKSNSVMGFFDALSAVEREREAEVPVHLRDANRDKEGFGHGAGYLYPHAYRDHWVEQQYLPSSLQGQVFYQPSDQGYEAQIRDRVNRLREAQLAALIEGFDTAMPEGLTLSPSNTNVDQWLQRTLSQTGDRLAMVRDRLFELAQIQRHQVILDLDARSGLLTWEAVRRVPEGGVYACVQQEQDYQALIEQARSLPELLRPTVCQSSLLTLAESLPQELQFDTIVGRNILMGAVDKRQILQSLQRLLQPEGSIILAEAIPKRAQRLYNLVAADTLSAKLRLKLKKAEEAIYTNANDAMVNWDLKDLQEDFVQAGFILQIEVETTETQVLITTAMLDRWFTPNGSSYIDRLGASLTPHELGEVQRIFRQQLLHQQVPWQTSIAFLRARMKPA
jgi:putative ATPase